MIDDERVCAFLKIMICGIEEIRDALMIFLEYYEVETEEARMNEVIRKQEDGYG